MSELFRTVYDRVRTVSNPGTPYLDDYKMEYDSDGKLKLIKDGKTNIHDMIQSYRSQCDINIILEKYLNIGDPAILNRRQAAFMDVSEIPTNYAEILQLNMDVENKFNSLPADIKAKFNNNKDEFFAAIGTEKFNSAFADFYKKPETTKESEVVTNE